MRLRPGVLLCLAAVACAACGSQPAPLPTTSSRGWPLGDLTMRHAGHDAVKLTVEIADTGPHQEAGLMNTKSLPTDRGEAFTWSQPVAIGFWMKDTLIPLDIVYWDARGRVVDILSMTPCHADPCAIYMARSPFVGAVELDPGVVEKAGVQVGDTVVLARRSTAVATGKA